MGGNVMMAFARFRVLVLGPVLVAGGVLFSFSADAQVYNRFGPANGILKGDTSTYITTSALSADVISLWTGTCNSTTFMRADGTCVVPSGTGVTSVGLTMPSGFSVGGSPVTSSGTLAVTTTLNGVIHGNGSGFTASNVALASQVSGTLPVANGGTGAVTLSGVLKGNTTSAISSAANSDVISLWTGTCNSSSYLRGDGSCNSPGGGGSVTSVSAGAGLSASPNPIISSGTLTLDLAHANTWTAQQTFTLNRAASLQYGVLLSAATPAFGFAETGVAANNGRWNFMVDNEQLGLYVLNDLESVNSPVMFVDRTGTTVDKVTFPNGNVEVGVALVPDNDLGANLGASSLRFASGFINNLCDGTCLGGSTVTTVGTQVQLALGTSWASTALITKDVAIGGTALSGAAANRGSLTVQGSSDAIITAYAGGSAALYMYGAAAGPSQLVAGVGRGLGLYTNNATLALSMTSAGAVTVPVSLSVAGLAVPKTAFAANINGNGGCSIGGAQQGITSCTRNSTGDYTFNLTAAGFTGAPACIPSGANSGLGSLASVQTSTSTSVRMTFNTAVAGNALQDVFFNVVCTGP